MAKAVDISVIASVLDISELHVGDSFQFADYWTLSKLGLGRHQRFARQMNDANVWRLTYLSDQVMAYRKTGVISGKPACPPDFGTEFALEIRGPVYVTRVR